MSNNYDNIPSQDPLIGPYFLQKKIRNSFVIALREIFRTDSVYPYVDHIDKTTDINASAIEITDIAPFDTIKTPCIVVSGIADLGSNFFFSNDLIQQNWQNGTLISETSGNQLIMNINLQVRALSSIERDEISDRAYIYLRTVRDSLAPLGIECREVAVNNPSEESLGAREIFVGGINVNTISEWIINTPVPSSEILSGISLAISHSGLTV